MAQFEVEKGEHEHKMRKMEIEMEEVFEMKVQEKLQKLKDIEADVSCRRWVAVQLGGACEVGMTFVGGRGELFQGHL